MSATSFMIRLFLTLGFVGFAPSLFAGHGDTGTWHQAMKDLAKSKNQLVPNQRIETSWDLENQQLIFKLDSPDQYQSLDLQTGKIAPLPSEPKNFRRNGVDVKSFAPISRRRARSNAQSPDGKWSVEQIDQQLTLIKNDDQSRQPLDFKIPEGSVWTREIFWHPDSSRFAICHRTQHPDRKIHYVRSSPEHQLQPSHEIHSYDKPGDLRNVSLPVVFFVDKKEPLALDLSLTPDPYSTGGFHWHRKDHRFRFEFIERGFGKFRLIEIDTDSKKQRIQAAEESDKFVHVFSKTFHYQLETSHEIVWLSERDGFLHLYLIDGDSGETLRQLTRGSWVIHQVHGIDEKSRQILIELSGFYPSQDPYYRHFALVHLDSGKIQLLTNADGTHEVSFSPDRSYYLVKWSRVDHAPVYEVHRSSDQKKIATLTNPSLDAFSQMGWLTPEKFVCKDRHNHYDIHGVILRPKNFDPKKKYPVIENIYAGPHGAFVPKAFRAWHGHKSEMAEAGFIVVQIDGLGTNHRGRDFQQVAYKNLKDSGFPDRIKWLKSAAEKYPQMDLSRVGIYGGSAGGQSSTAALLHHGDFYKAAVSDCGCHDNRIDKMWWNEQWLDWPVNESYLENSNLTHLSKLQGALMLTVGEMDRNVDPASTLQIVNGLIKEDKDFEFILVPNAGHGCGEMPHLRRKRIQFFQKHLGGTNDL